MLKNENQIDVHNAKYIGYIQKNTPSMDSTRIENKLIKKMNALILKIFVMKPIRKLPEALEDTISVFDDSEIKNETPI